MSVTIRLAEPNDLDVVTQITLNAYAHYVPRLGRKPAPMLTDYTDIIASSRLHVAVWSSTHDDDDQLLSGDVVGFLQLTPLKDAMQLGNLAVSPRAQGRGVGRKLMSFAEEKTIEAGYHVLTLFTNEVMTENVEMYGRMGFKETHRAVEHGLRRIYMAKSLDV